MPENPGHVSPVVPSGYDKTKHWFFFLFFPDSVFFLLHVGLFTSNLSFYIGVDCFVKHNNLIFDNTELQLTQQCNNRNKQEIVT